MARNLEILFKAGTRCCQAVVLFLSVPLLFAQSQEGEVPLRRSRLEAPFYYSVMPGPDIDLFDEIQQANPFFGFLFQQLLRAEKASPAEDELIIYGATLRNRVDHAGSTTRHPVLCLKAADVCALMRHNPQIESESAETSFARLLDIVREYDRLSRLIEFEPNIRQQAQDQLSEAIGPVKTAYVLSHLYTLSNKELAQVAGLSNQHEFLVLRRFGYIRNRMPGLDEAGREKMYPANNVADITVADSLHPYVPGWVPTYLYGDDDVEVTFDHTHNPVNKARITKALRSLWAQFSRDFHNLALQRYERERDKGNRSIFTDHLLNSLRDEIEGMDLERAFFFQVEDYLREKIFATLALIDGSSRRGELYHLPAIRRLVEGGSSFDIRQHYNADHFLEVHSLAKDPNKQDEIPLESLALLLAEHVDEMDFRNSLLIVQTDKAGARHFAKYGFVINENLSRMLGGDMRFLGVRGSDFVSKVREIYPLRGRIDVQLPNHLTKRIGSTGWDSACLAKLRGK